MMIDEPRLMAQSLKFEPKVNRIYLKPLTTKPLWSMDISRTQMIFIKITRSRSFCYYFVIMPVPANFVYIVCYSMHFGMEKCRKRSAKWKRYFIRKCACDSIQSTFYSSSLTLRIRYCEYITTVDSVSVASRLVRTIFFSFKSMNHSERTNTNTIQLISLILPFFSGTLSLNFRLHCDAFNVFWAI